MSSAPPTTATAVTRQLLEAHGLDCVIHDDWIIPNGVLPALRATWRPADGLGRLDIDVLVQEGVLIEECFAGAGSGDEALHNAVENFSINSLHVLLASFWGKDEPEQVTTESWSVGGQSFTAYIGNFGTRSTDGVSPQVPKEGGFKSEAQHPVQ